MRFLWVAGAAMVWFGVAGVLPAHAQELEPRAYSPAPTGTNFALAGYARSTGDVLFDPSLAVTDTDARINSVFVGYARTFGLAGRSASLSAVLPYARANISGVVDGARTEAYRSGIADLRMRFAMNLIGGPALTPREFAQRTPETSLGVSLSVVAPTGQYDSSRVINIGSNRWAVKPEIGLSQPIGNWFVEGSAGVWLFADNTNLAGGNTRSQDPLYTYQVHGGYTFRPGLWLAADATYYRGGQTSVNGADKQDLQENSRYGVTLSLPLSTSWSTKLAWANGYSTRIGGDFRTASITFQYRWFDR